MSFIKLICNKDYLVAVAVGALLALISVYSSIHPASELVPYAGALGILLLFVMLRISYRQPSQNERFKHFLCSGLILGSVAIFCHFVMFFAIQFI